MTVQFHLAHSATLRGAGVTAGGWCSVELVVYLYTILWTGPYYCAEDSLDIALNICIKIFETIDVRKLVEFAKKAGEDGNIDATSSLNTSRVFLVSGSKDTTVPQGTSYIQLIPSIWMTLKISIIRNYG